MTEEIVNRWAEINRISYIEAAREIKILLTMYPPKHEKDRCVNSGPAIQRLS